MCTQNAKVASVAGCSHLSKTWMILQLLYEKRTTAYHKDATLMDSENTDTQWFNQHPSSTQTSKLLAQLDEVNPMHGVDSYPYDEVKHTSTEALQAQQASAQSVDISRVQDTLLKELLDYYCEAGDVQSCATIAAAMNTVTNIELIMGKGWLQQVYMHYIDLLHQLQLYSIANYLVKNCPDLGIRQMNMKATTIYTSCSKCGKTIDPLPPKVAKVCQKSLCTQCFNITYFNCQHLDYSCGVLSALTVVIYNICKIGLPRNKYAQQDALTCVHHLFSVDKSTYFVRKELAGLAK
ncbi:hypothetical protein LEN26_001972 [Aphanomyces euteiches]|nr:hypothetical protein LEN26_001972 [Aphanomyces euteiches]